MATDSSIEIAADADLCWRLLADPRLVPEWIAGVADAAVVESDGERATRVRFTGMPSTGSLDYTVAYTYEDDARRIRWSTVTGPERNILGTAWIEPLDGG